MQGRLTYRGVKQDWPPVICESEAGGSKVEQTRDRRRASPTFSARDKHAPPSCPGPALVALRSTLSSSRPNSPSCHVLISPAEDTWIAQGSTIPHIVHGPLQVGPQFEQYLGHERTLTVHRIDQAFCFFILDFPLLSTISSFTLALFLRTFPHYE
jgi:hypothetical protein